MNLTQRQLQLFTTTAATLNISRASEQMYLSQSAYTRALQTLEAQLGVMLFHRTTRRLLLTADGERFLPVARRLLDDMSRAMDLLRGPSEGLSGTVSVAVGTAFGASVLPTALAQFVKAHPEVRVRIVDDTSRGITARVVRGEVDFGIGTVVGSAPGVSATPWLTAPLGLLAHADHPSTGTRPRAAQATRWPLIKEAEDTSIMQALREHGSSWAQAMETGVQVSSLSLQIGMVQAGVGVALVSALGASHPQAQGLGFAPLSPRIQRRVQLLQRRNRPLRPSAEALVQALRTAIPNAGLHPLVKIARVG